MSLNKNVISLSSDLTMAPISSPNTGANSENEDFYEQVYDELRQLAHAKMSKEYVYSTLQGTALVNEAWLRMGGEDQPRWQNRSHFFAAAAEAMRRILVDRARKRNRKKHGGELQRVSEDNLNEVQEQIEGDDQLLKINEALDKLESIDAQKAELVKLRYFFGMSFEETASTMDISVSTAKRMWTYSKSWLHREILSA
jgi:RNA polymerase sigma factor (TIGR02999 family)